MRVVDERASRRVIGIRGPLWRARCNDGSAGEPFGETNVCWDWNASIDTFGEHVSTDVWEAPFT